MFYCEPCGTERGWPTDDLMLALTGSVGPCECCRKRRVCFDVPSSQLPIPKIAGRLTDTETTDGR